MKSASTSSKKGTAKLAPPAKSVKPVKSVKSVKRVQSVKASTPAKTSAANSAAKAQPGRGVVAKPATAKKSAQAASVKQPAQAPGSKGQKSAASPKPVVPAVRPVSSHSSKKSESVTPVVEKKSIVPASVKAGKKAPPLPSAAVAVKPVANAAAAATLTSLGVPVRSGRPSSRLAQLTVPSMAQSVASNAAKSSFTQMASPQPIASPTAAHVKKNPRLADNWKNKEVAALTDEEVIAMPDQEYMNDVQMAFFRLKLVNLKNAVLNNAGETTEHLREDTVVVPDPADRATIEEEHALELRTRDRERKLLKKIEQSINRIDTGDYGYCDETGEPIGVARLLARPTATLSLEAQQRRELKQKMFGD